MVRPIEVTTAKRIEAGGKSLEQTWYWERQRKQLPVVLDTSLSSLLSVSAAYNHPEELACCTVYNSVHIPSGNISLYSHASFFRYTTSIAT